MYKHKLFLLPLAWLLVFMALACAPPDDDDRSSGPAITSASYDFATALLTVQGTDLSPTEAQIQTIVVDGVAFSSYTADDPATGPDSSDLAKGKYRIATDGTKLWLKLKDQHKAALEAKVGSNGLKKGLLTSSGAWAGLDTAKDLTVSNIPDKPSKQAEQAEQTEQQSPKQAKVEQAEQAKQAEQTEEVEDKQSKTETEDQSLKLPEAAITGASYNVGTALLTVQGSNLNATSATQAQIQTITVAGIAFSSYTADDPATGPDSRSLAKGKYRLHSAGTALWLYLTDQHKTTLNGKTGMDSNGLKDGLLTTSTGTWAGLDTAKGLAVSGNPEITSATYNVVKGVLVITGVNLPKAVTGWDFTQLRFVAGDGRKSQPLLRHRPTGINSARGSAASATSLTITLKGSEYDKAEAILVKNGKSDNDGAYNLEAAAGFAGGSAADTSNNPITVSGYVGFIKDLYYNVGTGVLFIQGNNLPRAVADWDFSKLTLVSGDGRKRYTLPQHATAGENKATGSLASRVGLRITLSGSVKAEAEKILVKDGQSDDNGAYNLEAAAGFAGYSAEDTSNPITVSGYVIYLDYVSYRANKGHLYISGNRLPTAVADWDFSKLTLVSGDGKKKYKLPQHAIGENTATGSSAGVIYLLIILSGSVKAEAEKILVKNGYSDNNGAYNLEAAAGFVPGSLADPTTKILVGK